MMKSINLRRAGLLLVAGLLLMAVVPSNYFQTKWRPARPVALRFVEHFVPGLEPEVDLRPIIRNRGLHVRDQGSRGDCTVFATTFLIEYQLSGMAGAPYGIDLSEEYLNWAGSQVTGQDQDGGFFTRFIRGFNTYGIALESQMPYQASYESSDTPSSTVIASAEAAFPLMRSPLQYPSQRLSFIFVKSWDNKTGMTSAELQTTLAILRSGRPVATGIWWPRNFAYNHVLGVPLLPDFPRSVTAWLNPPPPMFDGHSIDLVGFRESPQFPGGGYFIFRNSWSTGFGDDGYGFVSFLYLRTWANDAIAIVPQRPWWRTMHFTVPKCPAGTRCIHT